MRREFPKRVRVAAFDRCGGKCEICGVRLTVGKFAYDHIIADSIGGEPILSNCQVACDACHGAKTATIDTPRAAKTKRQHAAHIGARVKGRGFPPPARRNRASAPLVKTLPPRRLTP